MQLAEGPLLGQVARSVKGLPGRQVALSMGPTLLRAAKTPGSSYAEGQAATPAAEAGGGLAWRQVAEDPGTARQRGGPPSNGLDQLPLLASCQRTGGRRLTACGGS